MSHIVLYNHKYGNYILEFNICMHRKPGQKLSQLSNTVVGPRELSGTNPGEK